MVLTTGFELEFGINLHYFGAKSVFKKFDYKKFLEKNNKDATKSILRGRELLDPTKSKIVDKHQKIRDSFKNLYDKYLFIKVESLARHFKCMI